MCFLFETLNDWTYSSESKTFIEKEPHILEKKVLKRLKNM